MPTPEHIASRTKRAFREHFDGRYRVRQKSGLHHQGEATYEAGDVFECTENEFTSFRDKFELLNAIAPAKSITPEEFPETAVLLCREVAEELAVAGLGAEVLDGVLGEIIIQATAEAEGRELYKKPTRAWQSDPTALALENWKSELLAELRQNPTTSALVPEEKGEPQTREERFQAFKKETGATHPQVAESAEVDSRDLYRWRHNELADESQMSERIEDLISGKRPLQPKNQESSG